MHALTALSMAAESPSSRSIPGVPPWGPGFIQVTFIVRSEGQEPSDARRLSMLVAAQPPGKVVHLVVKRATNEVTVQLVLDAANAVAQATTHRSFDDLR